MHSLSNITINEKNQRIDQWLSQNFPYSRSFFHHIIARGGIQVNNRPIKKSYKLKQGDNIQIDNLERYLSSVLLEEVPYIDIPVVLEKEDYLVINKPKGVLSHPNSIWNLSTPSVVGFLYHRYKGLPSTGSFIRAGLVHRLDKDTDGLMIIAKTERGLSHFKNLFQQKSTAKGIEEKECIPLKKIYHACCYFSLKGEKFFTNINNSGVPFFIREKVVPKVPYPIVKEGITKILDYQKVGNLIYFTLEILTGRTHQIRYHLSHKGFPIVGDYLYGTEEDIPLQLTAKKIIFKDIKNDEIITLSV